MAVAIFTQRTEIIESYNERRDAADQRISSFIRACGYTPVPVPNNSGIAADIAGEIKPVGIVLTGGNSLVKYGGNAPERDETDRLLIKIAAEKKIPLYGFCRGMQSILDYFGNELIDVPAHVAVRHIITGAEGRAEVNSYHNQACVEIRSSGLKALMKTKDGVIEKIMHKHLPIIGTMWHPERENIFRETDITCLRELFGRGK